MRRFCWFIAAFVLAATCAARPAAAAWSIQTVDPTMYAGNTLAMRLDAQGLRRYAWWGTTQGVVVAGDGWASEVVPGPYLQEGAGDGRAAPASAQLLVTISTDLGLGPDDTPWVAYARVDCRSGCTGTVRVAHRDAVGWTTENLGTTVSRPSIDVDRDGAVHVAYAIPGNQLVYCRRAPGGGWTSNFVGSAWPNEPTLRIAADGTPHVSYIDAGKLVHSVFAGGLWHPESVDSGGVSAALLAFGPDGAPRFAYVTTGSGIAKGLWYAEPGAGGWTRTLARPGLDCATRPALAFDGAGDPFVAFNDQNGLDLRFGSRKAGQWTFGDIETAGNTGYTPCAALDPLGRPVIAYQADYSVGVHVAVGEAITDAPPAAAPARFALRPVGGVRAGRPLEVELASPAAGVVTLAVVDVAGRLVAAPGALEVAAGVTRLRVAPGLTQPGVYFVRATARDGATATLKQAVTR